MLSPLMNSPEQTLNVEVLPKHGAASGFVLIISKTDAQFDEVRARVTLTAIAQRKKWEGVQLIMRTLFGGNNATKKRCQTYENISKPTVVLAT